MILFASAGFVDSAVGSPEESRDTVIVLHGLGRTKLSMRLLASRIEKHGFDVINISYPSRSYCVADLADVLHKKLEGRGVDRAARVHFVTHSLGGIVVRAYLKAYRPDNLGRVVMLSPPNQGSEVVDRMRGGWFYRIATGPVGQELGTEASSTPNLLGPADFTLGVIAGDRSINPLFSAWVHGADDGTVSVQRTRIEGMADFMVVPWSHTFIMRSSKVADQVLHFLEHGKFTRPAA